MRQFRHLTRTQISEIICAYTEGETQASIAQRFDVDASTINYHVKKYDQAYPEEGGVYAVIKTKARKVCIHPSSRCSLCTLMFDQINRDEREQIRKLTVALEAANSSLRVAGLYVENVDYTESNDTA